MRSWRGSRFARLECFGHHDPGRPKPASIDRVVHKTDQSCADLRVRWCWWPRGVASRQLPYVGCCGCRRFIVTAIVRSSVGEATTLGRVDGLNRPV